MKFYKKVPGDGHPPCSGSSLVYLGPDADRFEKAVEALGYVVRP